MESTIADMKITHQISVILVLGLILFVPISGTAQEIKGIVYDMETSALLRGITVKNIKTKEISETNALGEFFIKGNVNDLLELSGAGYSRDTVFIYDEGIKRVFLVRDDNTIVINEVFVSRFTDSRLDEEIARARHGGQALEANQQRGGLRISPSRLFGKSGKTARKNLKLLLEEKDNRTVDKVFTSMLIRSMTPLTEEEIPHFREMYRPSVEYVQQSSPESIKIYINESYIKYRKQFPKKESTN